MDGDAIEKVVVKCPKCGHFLGEMGNFLRVRCCGYEIIVSSLRPDVGAPRPRPSAARA